MLAKFFVIATFLAASAFGVAVPAPVADAIAPVDLTKVDGDPIAICKERGIDIHGPIPGDATKEADGGYYFTEGSDAFHWVRAQIASPATSSRKRQGYANIGIGMFAQDWCGGNGAWFDDVIYGNHNYNTLNYYSVGISYRGLRNNEHLDFSRLSGSDWCGTYAYSAGYETPVGCFNSQVINCFELWTS